MEKSDFVQRVDENVAINQPALADAIGEATGETDPEVLSAASERLMTLLRAGVRDTARAYYEGGDV